MDSIVTAVDVRRRYGEGDAAVNALAGVTVGFERGRFSAIMGPSGSGKSTLMHILAGLDRPTSGSVTLDGDEITGLDDAELTKLRRDKLGFVFQFFNLIPTLSVLENVLLPAELAGLRVRPRALELLERVGLADRQGAFPDGLSGGEQQRVAIARALVRDPRLVLADEPTGNLDDATGASVMELLDSVTRRSGKTLLLVTHSRELAALSDRELKIEDGRLV
jgi:putative ABC transport system ATP-binding protein